MIRAAAGWPAGGPSGSLDAADDRIVAGRAVDGDTAAFAVLVRRFTPLMRAYARRMLNGSADVDDVVQESFITAWERLPELTDLERVKSWLMRITSRKAIDRLRHDRAHVDLADVDPEGPASATPPQQAQARSLVEALGDALETLPAAQRETWLLREVGELSYDDIAGELGLPLATVRGLLARARKALIVRMEQWR